MTVFTFNTHSVHLKAWFSNVNLEKNTSETWASSGERDGSQRRLKLCSDLPRQESLRSQDLHLNSNTSHQLIRAPLYVCALTESQPRTHLGPIWFSRIIRHKADPSMEHKWEFSPVTSGFGPFDICNNEPHESRLSLLSLLWSVCLSVCILLRSGRPWEANNGVVKSDENAKTVSREWQITGGLIMSDQVYSTAAYERKTEDF